MLEGFFFLSDICYDCYFMYNIYSNITKTWTMNPSIFNESIFIQLFINVMIFKKLLASFVSLNNLISSLSIDLLYVFYNSMQFVHSIRSLPIRNLPFLTVDGSAVFYESAILSTIDQLTGCLRRWNQHMVVNHRSCPLENYKVALD